MTSKAESRVNYLIFLSGKIMLASFQTIVFMHNFDKIFSKCVRK